MKEVITLGFFPGP